MENRMIPYPHRSYVLELFNALGDAAKDFVLVGGQALRFHADARATRDFDFVVDVWQTRNASTDLRSILGALGYAVVPRSENFQFEKDIPGTNETMRVELLGPDEAAYGQGIRVDVQPGVHARRCLGASVVLRESDDFPIDGKLPDGTDLRLTIRVARPHALVLLKALAMDDRYQNIGGGEHREHDRQEARTHAADIIDISRRQCDVDPAQFRRFLVDQFTEGEALLKKRFLRILDDYFNDLSRPGFILYEELLAEKYGAQGMSRTEREEELTDAARVMTRLLAR